MDPIAVLHNAARHYCVEQASRWHRVYGELAAAGRQRTTTRAGNWDYTDAAYGVFPRYRILEAIQRDVEQFVPADFSSEAELRETLVAVGETAQVPSTKFERPAAVRAIEEERRRFLDFARSADQHELCSLPVLPFRRVLGEAEHRRLHGAFVRRWGQWYGGCVSPPEAGVGAVTLHVAAMDEPGAYGRLRDLLEGQGVGRLVELREWGDGYEREAADAPFTYTGAEGFWTSGDMGWMVYASHESSITFGGPWLIDGMRACLPAFDCYIYRGWDLAAYPAPTGS